jgi:hypothetical protein
MQGVCIGDGREGGTDARPTDSLPSPLPPPRWPHTAHSQCLLGPTGPNQPPFPVLPLPTARFLDMMEQYFEQPEEKTAGDIHPELRSGSVFLFSRVCFPRRIDVLARTVTQSVVVHCAHMQGHARIHTHTHACTRIHTYTHFHTCTHIHAHTRTYTHIHAHARTYTHTQVHIHTSTL